MRQGLDLSVQRCFAAAQRTRNGSVVFVEIIENFDSIEIPKTDLASQTASVRFAQIGQPR